MSPATSLPFIWPNNSSNIPSTPPPMSTIEPKTRCGYLVETPRFGFLVDTDNEEDSAKYREADESIYGFIQRLAFILPSCA